MPWLYFTIMIKTQIQLPDRLYHEAKRVAHEREVSLAEVVRRGVEYITRVYPPVPGQPNAEWQLPIAVSLKMRPGVTLESLRDLAAADAEPMQPAVQAPSRRSRTAN